MSQLSELTYDQLVERAEALRPKINDLIEEFFQLHCAAARYEEDLPEQMHLAEFMIVCAWQAFNDKGQRMGDVRVLTRDGNMPTYIARGMNVSAGEFIERASMVCTCEGDDDAGN